MTPHEKVANIFAFLSILFGEHYELMNKLLDFSPDYIIEKYERYIESSNIEYPWGMHPVLRMSVFNVYIDKWALTLSDL